MRFTTRKAFTLFEMLLVTFIIGSLALLAYSSWPQNDYRHYYFMDDYLTLQARAMADNAEYLLENAYDYAKQLQQRLRGEGFRVVVDLSADRMNAKIRNAQKMKTPYMLIIGEKEIADDLVSVRYRGGKQVNGVKTADFIAEVHKAIDSKAQI